MVLFLTIWISSKLSMEKRQHRKGPLDEFYKHLAEAQFKKQQFGQLRYPSLNNNLKLTQGSPSKFTLKNPAPSYKFPSYLGHRSPSNHQQDSNYRQPVLILNKNNYIELNYLSTGINQFDPGRLQHFNAEGLSTDNSGCVIENGNSEIDHFNKLLQPWLNNHAPLHTIKTGSHIKLLNGDERGVPRVNQKKNSHYKKKSMERYEIPQNINLLPLTYTPKNNYESPGALNSYGDSAVVNTQHQHHLTNYRVRRPHDMKLYSIGSENIEVAVKYTDLEESTGRNTTGRKFSNHNYDGLGIPD